MAKQPNQTTQLPEELFHAIAALVSRMIYIAEEECKVAPFELLVLWHIRHFGRIYVDDQTVILRQELTRMLTKKFRFTDPGVSKLLADLQEDGFIVRTAVSNKERARLFGSPGDTRVVILNAHGKAKIEEFKGVIRTRAGKWLNEQNRATRIAVKGFQPVLEGFARWLVRRYEPERVEMLYSADTRE